MAQQTIGDYVADGDVIKEGDSVIIQVNGDHYAFVRAKCNLKIKVGKSFVPMDPLIGQRFGTLFTLSADSRSLQIMPHMPSNEWDVPAETSKTNSHLVDEGFAQKLSKNDIVSMRQAGVAGADILQALTEHSTTFDTKTEFAQNKYKKRKAKKYIVTGSVLRPTTASICQAFTVRQASRIGFLRVDALAVMLSLANVGPHARVLALDMCGGMAAGAVTERLGGYGSLMLLRMGDKPPSLDAWRHYNFSAEEKAVLKVALIEELQASSSSRPDDSEDAVGGSSSEVHGVAEHEGNGASPAAATPAVPFNSCIVAAPNLTPLSVMRRLLPFLGPSTPFAVWMPWPQPLAECMQTLRLEGSAVNMALHETWFREIQVLPARTHPLMNMNHGGGFILAGTTVLQQ